MPLLISYHLALDFPGLRQYKRYKGKLRVSRQAQTCIIMSSRSSGGEVKASFLLPQICIHSPCYSGCTLYGKSAQEQNSWPTFFAQTGKNHCEILFKTYCLWMQFSCNHNDHMDRKSSVLPFNLSMACRQGEEASVSVISSHRQSQTLLCTGWLYQTETLCV